LINTGLKAMNDSIPEFFAALYAEDPDHADDYYFRIMLRARERQPSQQKQEIISQVQAITARSFPQGEVSGYFVLLTNMIDSILRDQWRTFGVALAGIFVIMMVALRSVPLALIAVVPNVVPILVINGIMGGWV
jgi:predicted RND superfamily exporter protein